MSDGVSRFEQHTSVEPVGHGRYRAVLDPSWWILAGPNGGYVAAVMLRALLAEVADPRRRARSLTVQYLRAPVEGDAHIEVSVERAGRSVSNVSVRMTQDDRPVALALASCVVDREGSPEFDEDPGLPSDEHGATVPPASDVEPIDVDAERDVPMRQHWDLRWVLGARPFLGEDSPAGAAHSGGWLRPAEPVPVDDVVLVAMCDAWLPPLFSRVGMAAAVPTVDLTVHLRRRPVDPFGHCFVDFTSPLGLDGHLVEHGRILDADGRLLVESRQLALLR